MYDLSRLRFQYGYSLETSGHRFDPNTPIEETVCILHCRRPSHSFNPQMQALHDVVQAGYVRYIGMSSCYAWQCKCISLSRFACSASLILCPSQSTQCRVCIASPEIRRHRSQFSPADYAITNKLTPFISMQNHYSLLYREDEREMFPTLKVRSLIPHRNFGYRYCLPVLWCWFHSVVTPCARRPHQTTVF
jgi:hypothetical protein